MKLKRAGLFVLPLTLLAASQAQAELVTVEVTAQVDYVDDPGFLLDGQVAPGSLITGTYTYDAATPDAEPYSEVGYYPHPAGSPVGFDLSAGTLHFVYDPVLTDVRIDIANFPDFDGYHVGNWGLAPLANGATVDGVDIDLQDPTASAHDSDVLSATPPDLSLFETRMLQIQGMSPEGFHYQIKAALTSLGGSAAPATTVTPSQPRYKVIAQVADIYDPANILGGSVVLGDTVSGTYTIDTSVADIDPYPEIGLYPQPLTAGLGFDMAVNGIALRSEPQSMPVEVRVENWGSGPDYYDVYSPENAPLPNGAQIVTLALATHDMEGTVIDSDALNADLPLLSGYENRDVFVEGTSPDGANWFFFRAEIVSIELDDGKVFEVSPPAATYDRYQQFALGMIFDTGVEPGLISGTLNGADITPYLNNECHPGAPNDQQRITLVCPYFSGNLTSGLNELQVSVDVGGQTYTESLTYDVIGY